MREMVGGCCVCSDERGWAENPLVYCDGHGCSVAVHQACYGIVQVPTGPWFCRKCESQERAARVRCELCPHKDGALKRTDSGGWAHVVCALYIPEVQFANVLTMEPIVLQYVPHERYIKTCYICEDHGRESKAACGACMTCNRPGCRQAFHVTCAQMAGLLCEEEGPEADNVKYCGYCKHHYSKMQKKLRSLRETVSSSFNHSRGRSSSPSQDKHSSHHHRPRKSHKDKTKQKERHKKSSEGMPSLGSALTSMPSLGSSLSSSLEKLSSSHHGVSKEGEGKPKKLSSHGLPHRSSKKSGSGTVKSCSSSSCSSSPFNAGGTSLSSQEFLQLSTSSSSCRLEREPEEPAAAEPREERKRRSLPAEDEEEEEEEEEEEKEEEEEEEEEEEAKEASRERERENKYTHKPPALQPPALTPANGPPEPEANTFETKVTISTFGSIMRITSSSGLGAAGSKVRKVSSKSSSSSSSRSLQSSTPPVLEEPVPPERPSSSPSLPRERRHRGNKKSRHGPGRPRGSKNREREKRGEEDQQQQQQQQQQPTSLPPPPPQQQQQTHHHRHHHHHQQQQQHQGQPMQTQSQNQIQTQGQTQGQGQSQPQQQGGSLGFSAAPYPSPPSLPPAAFPTAAANSLLSSGIYSSHKDPLSLGGGVCSTPLSTSLLPSHIPSLPLTPPTSTANTQMHAGAGVPYTLSASQPFSSFLSSAPALPPLLSQAQSTLPESDLEDCRFPCQDSSPRESLSSQSPMSSLPLLFEQREGTEQGRPRPESVPHASSHIELLLEKHSNGETGVNIVEMLQSLHSLQQENQRLQDQILSLTAKRERLQLLNVELAVPFVPPGAAPAHLTHLPPGHPGQSHLPTLQAVATAAAQVNVQGVPAGFLSCAHDPLSSSKSPLTKSSFLSDNSFIASSEDLHSGSPSRSSSSFSFQSTPPPQQSPASFSQPLMNGLGRGLGESLAGIGGGGGGGVTSAGAGMGVVGGGMMDGLAGGTQLGGGVNGALGGGLNGVMGSAQAQAQVQVQVQMQHSATQGHLPALQPQPPPLNSHTLAQSLQLPKSLSPSSLLSEHQKQLLLQKQQQQQLQEFLVLKHFTPEQQRVVYQMLQQQQQRQQELQRLSLGAALPSSAPSVPLMSQSPSMLPQANASPLQASQGNAFFGLQDNSLHKPGSVGEKGGDKNG
ncbi:hypothetical protein ACEWY4_017877 [Coilia grayii]|uniref:Uncharacterized protein n=1 Tax=Coilia grayii TaxID=363190 RepID=A0ABD1JI47_9TELE